MKIILIAKSFSKGGAASGARNLRDSLKSVGHEVICLDGYDAQRSRVLTRFFRLIERIVERVFLDAETHFFKLWPSTFNLRDLDEKLKPDVIQICDVSGNTISFRHIRHLKCPVVHRMSDFWPYKGSSHYCAEKKIRRSMADWFHRAMIFDEPYCPAIRVAPSQWLADSALDNFLPSKIAFIPNAVNCNSSLRTKPVPDSSTLTFGFISNFVLDPRKGFERLIRKLEYVSRSGHVVRLKVFGEIKERHKKYYKGLEVEYLGAFKPADTSHVYGSFHMLLCPSYLDNSPNVLSEALAHGLPAIGQTGTGMASYINSDFGGLIDFDDLSHNGVLLFTQLVKRLLDNYEQCSDSAYSFVKRELSYTVIGQKYTDIYNDLR